MSTWGIRIGTCINVKIGLGIKWSLLELGGRGYCDINGVTNKDYFLIAFLF